MKKISLILILMFSFFSISVFAQGIHEPGTGITNPEIKEAGQVTPQLISADVQETTLSDAEIEGLKMMREEEKLARDVYLELYDEWNLQIFNNIAQSEQTHTNAVKSLMDAYGLEDPVVSDERGVFTNTEFETLYDSLVEQGKTSLLDALIVGAIIEDLDIKDLNELIEATSNEDIILVYENLRKGSRNHMRSYIKQIENNEGTYTAQYLEQTEIDSIIESDHERGPILDNNSNIVSDVESHFQVRKGTGLMEGEGQRKMLQTGNYQNLEGKQMNIQKQTNNKLSLESSGVSADCPMCDNMEQEQLQGKTRLYAKFSNGKNTEIKVMPDTASQTALQKLRLRNCDENCTIELKEVGSGTQTRAVYEMKTQRDSKVFGIFKTKMNVQAQVDAETGELVQVKKAWWAFLATEPEE